ncbi:MAG: flagellar export protein FliJ [Sarcina sp.]
MENGFDFKLQKILDIRIEKEEEKARIFKKAQSEKIEIEDKLKELEESYMKYSLVTNKETVAYQKIKRIYVQNVSKAIETTKKELVEKEKEVVFKREEAKKSQIERKTVEKLKEKELEAFKQEQNRIEKLFNDEMALYGHMRKLERG